MKTERSPERLDALRSYKRDWQRRKRAEMKGIILPKYLVSYVQLNRGNEKYRQLCLEEAEWLKKSSFCETCQQMHPPMRFL